MSVSTIMKMLKLLPISYYINYEHGWILNQEIGSLMMFNPLPHQGVPTMIEDIQLVKEEGFWLHFIQKDIDAGKLDPWVVDRVKEYYGI